MRSINKVIIIGNVTRDPEIKQTVSGQPIATFGIATNRDWMTRNGERHTSSEFHEVVAWSKLADICSKYIRKGKLIYIEGYLKTRSWDTPEGVKKFRTEIVVNDLIMLDKRANGEGEQPLPAGESMGGEMMEPMPEDMPMSE
jgi:single-strand DNA-binding protein